MSDNSIEERCFTCGKVRKLIPIRVEEHVVVFREELCDCYPVIHFPLGTQFDWFPAKQINSVVYRPK